MSYLLYGFVSDETFKALTRLRAVVFLFFASIIAIAVPWARDFLNACIFNVHRMFDGIIQGVPGKNRKAFYQSVKKSDMACSRSRGTRRIS
jgi:hypothetical protein